VRSPFLSISAVSFLLAMLPALTVAGDEPTDWRSWPTGERLVVSVGGFYPTLNTKVAVADEDGIIGAVISFEDDLKLDKRKATLFGDLRWRVAKRHTIGVSYFELDRSSFESGGGTIIIGDEQLDPNLPIESFFDIQVLDFSYSYSFLMDERKELYAGLGLSLEELKFGIRGTADSDNPGDITPGEPIEERVELIAPLPTLNLGFNYAFTDKWMLDLTAGWFAVGLELADNEDFDGSIIRGSAGIRWKAFENFGLRASYELFDVDIDYRKRSAVGELQYDYRGPAIGVEWFF